MNNLQRCDWCKHDPIYIKYHDTEWGVPVHDDQKLFEFLILEGAQDYRQADEYNKKPYWREPQICYVEYSDTNKGARTPQETRVIRTYPITIRVHLNATQNDVMGMIKREWPSINKHLWARRRRLPKIREHKYPFELVTFLMANKGIPDRKHLASEANKRFPKYGFGYADVSKIIQDEAKRRRRDLP